MPTESACSSRPRSPICERKSTGRTPPSPITPRRAGTCSTGRSASTSTVPSPTSPTPIRGSLTSVLGFSRLLQRDIGAPLTEHQRTSVHHIHEAGAHLLRIVNDLSDLTQLEATAVEARDEIVDVAAVVREVAASGATVLTRDPAAIIVETPPPLPPVRGNSGRLTQLLLALMQSPARIPGGPVELSTRADNESVTVIVTHHGTSLSAQDLPSLFDPFAPIDATSTLQDDGRRLRLALARALATAIGGSIEVDGQSGGGLTFTLRMPVAADLSAVA